MEKINPVFYRLFFLSLLLGITSQTAAAHEWMAPKNAASIKSPILADSHSKARGKLLFLDNCASCHGENALGMKAKDTGMESDSPNLKKRLSSHTDGDFFWKIQQGRGEMPSFQNSLEDNEIWDIINYLKD